MHRFLLALLIASAGCIVSPVGPTPSPIDDQVAPSPGEISVLLIFEEEERFDPSKRPFLDVINSTKIKAYLDSHCKRGKDGIPQWRFVDKDVDVSSGDDFWQRAIDEAKADSDFTTPWLMITNGTKGVAGQPPLPESATLELLKKWGGD